MRIPYFKEILAFLGTMIGLSLLAQAVQAAPVTSNPMAEIQKILKLEEQARLKFTEELDEALEKMQAVNASRAGDERIDSTLIRHESRVADIRNNLTENQLRIELLNDLVSALDRKKGGVKELPAILREMARKEILASIETSNDSRVWVFEIYLSIALRDIMEPSENLGDFIKRYLVYSTIRDPRSPQDFLKTRNYIGGTLSTTVE